MGWVEGLTLQIVKVVGQFVMNKDKVLEKRWQRKSINCLTLQRSGRKLPRSLVCLSVSLCLSVCLSVVLSFTLSPFLSLSLFVAW